MVDLDGLEKVKVDMKKRDLIISKTRAERGPVQMHLHKLGNAYRRAFWRKLSHFYWKTRMTKYLCEAICTAWGTNKEELQQHQDHGDIVGASDMTGTLHWTETVLSGRSDWLGKERELPFM